MRILYLFGNGFDLHVGLKTSYPEFLKYYLAQPIPTELDDVAQRYIKRLKEDIKNNIKLWSDLELRYGQHMSNLGGMGKAVHSLQEELDIINDDIRGNLSKYIAEQDTHGFFAENAKKRFLEDIIEPEKNLRDFERETVNNLRSNLWYRTHNHIDIITFNYTRTIEHLIGKTPIQVSPFEIHNPIHLHGYYDSRMIMGVNDASQIDNDQLRSLTYATDALVKPDNNHSYGTAHTNRCDNLINSAQLICCYGLSFGDTDKLWWKKICDELKNRPELFIIIYAHVDKTTDFSNSGHKMEYLMRQVKDHFLSQGGVDESERQRLAQRIFVSINDPIFNIQIDDRTPVEKLMGKSAPGTVERLEETIREINKN